MKPILPLIAAAMVAAAGVLWIATAHDPRVAAATADGPADGVAPTSTPRIAGLKDSPEARAWQQRQEFETRARRFLQNAPKLGAVERSEQARALSASIDGYERDGGLSAGEALLLRSGLVKATVDDEQAQAEQLADLMDRYRSRADQRMQAYAAQHAQDPKFEDYKARERSIVAEVMGMGKIPGGMSRDEYLRVRLQQAREIAYR
jgi:hypothetical protein